MPAGRYDIRVRQGSTEGLTFELYQPDGVTPRDITGYQARMQVRRRALDSTVVWSGTSNPAAGITIQASPGKVSLRWEAAQLSAIKAATYIYDCELVAPSGDVECLAAGDFIVDAEVTR